MIILSSPLGFPGATISYEEITFPESLAGCTHYVGHPATKALLEALGAEPAPTGAKWQGPAVGEVYLAVPLAAANSRGEGWTRDTAVSSVKELKAIRCTRIA